VGKGQKALYLFNRMQQEGVQPNLSLLKLDFENKVSSFHHVQETSGMVGKVKKLQHTASEIRNHKVLLDLLPSVTMKATLDIEAKKE